MTRAHWTRTFSEGAGPTGADLARRLSAAAWGEPLRWPTESSDEASPEAALGLLRRSLRLQRRADLERIHPSWWVRALKDESPAVQRLVAANGPPALTEALLAALPLDADGLRPDREPDPEVRDWVLALWAERLVGGEPLRDDEPPAVVAIAGPPPIARFRLLRVVGLAKSVLAGYEPTGREGPLGRERMVWLSQRLGIDDPRAREWAGRDLRALLRESPPRGRNLALLGLATMARLLADCDPFRVRWALQHLPYPVAKRARSLMPNADRRSPAVSRLEAMILKAAWQRLNHEGRLGPPHPEERTKESDAR